MNLPTGTCRDTRAHLSEYLEGDLRGLTRLRVVRHFARCERCREVLASLQRTVERLRAFGRAEPGSAPGLADAVVARIRGIEGGSP